MSDRVGILSVSQSAPPGEYNFNTCVWGFGESALDGVSGWGKSGWKKKEWLRRWSAARQRTNTNAAAERGF